MLGRIKFYHRYADHAHYNAALYPRRDNVITVNILCLIGVEKLNSTLN